ncbi:hypothetical protein ASPCADRAFT_508366 [Aspergillus carbonarius ITEM 5010]|uniref:Uncharacterized protein n=1 Tax=Aspergillus carbonarius (strain ITEM 5010) TaxID=602072 RepID=A0A1R3RHD3_ASPC5|nr:hypothetical protein ASPCADRAFT_508366 [Aspergillus carbonarius ITEM 5010]
MMSSTRSSVRAVTPPSPSPSPVLHSQPIFTIPTTTTTSGPLSTTCPRLLLLLSEILLIFQGIATLANIRILITTDLTNHPDIPNTEDAVSETDPMIPKDKDVSSNIHNITFMICNPIPIQEVKSRILCARSDIFFPSKHGILYAHQHRQLDLTFVPSQYGLPGPHPAHNDWSQVPSAATLIKDLKPGRLPTLAPRDQVIWQVYFCGLGGHGSHSNQADACTAWVCLARVGGLFPVKWAEWEVETLLLGLDDVVKFSPIAKETWMLELGLDQSWRRYLPPVRRSWRQLVRRVGQFAPSFGAIADRQLMLLGYVLGLVYVLYLGILWVMDASSRAWVWVLLLLGILG